MKTACHAFTICKEYEILRTRSMLNIDRFINKTNLDTEHHTTNILKRICSKSTSELSITTSNYVSRYI